MMPDVPVREIMQRTMDNYRFLDDSYRRGSRVFEVTQLVNSFLGAFAHPWEEWRKELGGISIAEARKRGWPAAAADDLRDEIPQTLGQLLRLMRNSIAHGNIQYLKDQNNDIGAVFIWNETPGHRWRTWGATLDVSTLRRFLECFEAEARDLPDRSPRRPPERHVADRPEPPRCECCKQPVPENAG